MQAGSQIIRWVC